MKKVVFWFFLAAILLGIAFVIAALLQCIGFPGSTAWFISGLVVGIFLAIISPIRR